MPGRFSIALLALGLVTLAACDRRDIPPAGRRPPNVLLITTDDMGRSLGAYGDPYATTPAIDRLAAEGIRFDNAFVAAPSCSPSRAAVLTGLHPHASGQFGFVRNTGLRAGIRTIPERLAAAGYRTGRIGKFHVNDDAAPIPFDLSVELPRAERSFPEAYAERVSSFLRSAGAQPFFLMVDTYPPHTPYPGQAGLPAWSTPHDPARVLLPAAVLDTPELRRFVARMYDAHALADSVVGAVLAALDRSGRSDSTLVLLISDHGPALPAGKTTLFDGGIRVPLLARWPAVVEPGRTTPGLVSAVDILPTLLDVAGLPPDADLHGRSILPLLAGESDGVREVVFAANTLSQGNRYFPQRMARTNRFKYVRNLRSDIEFRNNAMQWWIEPMLRRWDEDPQARFLLERIVRHPREELYDLELDPDEMKNLVDDPAHAETLARMRDRLERWMRDTEDPWLELWNGAPDGSDPFEPQTTRDGAFEGRWLDGALEEMRRAARDR